MCQRLIPSYLLSKVKESLEKLNTRSYNNDSISTKVMPEVVSQKK